ncbi:spore germination protein [Sporosarcina sp. FSL W8-0480]|uniref:spore germination protein n=1 Tax=Sporosarcina sp. FSL W8-0480 TaxID=2954701 RepID=UPI0030DD9803
MGAPKNSNPSNDQKNLTQPFSYDFEKNLSLIKEAFSYPTNQSLKIRDLTILSGAKKGVILFLEGTVDTKAIEETIIGPLIKITDIPEDGDIMSIIEETIVFTTGTKQVEKLQDAVKDLLGGNTLILFEGEHGVISAATTGFENRGVSEPTVENVVRGPKESFNESMAVNQSLIRKQINDNRLLCESISIGNKIVKEVSIIYLKGVVDEELLKDVKKKINEIESDLVQNLSILEQYIESRTYSLVPSTLLTERPDRACSFLLNGHIVLLMNSAPYALIVPVTFWNLFHTIEDQYLRWAYANFTRIISLISIFIALYTPAIYLAVSTFHIEMLPPDLLFAIAATREVVPIPVLWEIILLEIVFEILREAGIRIPSVIGPTIGIVGALILGQAAVQANLVSPILVIVVAITGLSSFVIQDLNLNFMIRLLRFGFIFIANFMGFFGIFLATACLFAYMVSLKSFNVPFLAPYAPYFQSPKGLIFRPPVWKQALFPFYSNSKNNKRGNASKVGSADD